MEAKAKIQDRVNYLRAIDDALDALKDVSDYIKNADPRMITEKVRKRKPRERPK